MGDGPCRRIHSLRKRLRQPIVAIRHRPDGMAVPDLPIYGRDNIQAVGNLQSEISFGPFGAEFCFRGADHFPDLFHREAYVWGRSSSSCVLDMVRSSIDVDTAQVRLGLSARRAVAGLDLLGDARGTQPAADHDLGCLRRSMGYRGPD